MHLLDLFVVRLSEHNVKQILSFVALSLSFCTHQLYMKKALIIDDEMRARRIMKVLLQENCPDIEVVAEAENVPEAVQLINKHRPDIVFSDIEMPEYSGFELLKFIKEPQFALIFVTAYQQYAIKAFEVAAVDYLLKPVEPEDLIRAVKKAGNYRFEGRQQQLDMLQNNMKSQYISRMALPTAEGLLFIETDNISYLSADGSYTNITLATRETILITKRLKFFEESLEHPHFFRPHRSFIINLNKVSKYIRSNNAIVMDDGFRLNLAKDRREDFMNAYKSLKS